MGDLLIFYAKCGKKLTEIAVVITRFTGINLKLEYPAVHDLLSNRKQSDQPWHTEKSLSDLTPKIVQKNLKLVILSRMLSY